MPTQFTREMFLSPQCFFANPPSSVRHFIHQQISVVDNAAQLMVYERFFSAHRSFKGQDCQRGLLLVNDTNLQMLKFTNLELDLKHSGKLTSPLKIPRLPRFL